MRPDSKNAGNLPDDPGLHVVRCGLSHVADCVEAVGHADGFFHFAWGGVNRQEIDSQSAGRKCGGLLECVRAALKLGCRVFMDAGSRVEYGTPDCAMQ